MQLICVIENLTGLNHKRKQCGRNKHLLENLYISSTKVYDSLTQNLLQNDKRWIQMRFKAKSTCFQKLANIYHTTSSISLSLATEMSPLKNIQSIRMNHFCKKFIVLRLLYSCPTTNMWYEMLFLLPCYIHIALLLHAKIMRRAWEKQFSVERHNIRKKMSISENPSM